MKVGKRVLHEILTGGQSEHRENSGAQLIDECPRRSSAFRPRPRPCPSAGQREATPAPIPLTGATAASWAPAPPPLLDHTPLHPTHKRKLVDHTAPGPRHCRTHPRRKFGGGVIGGARNASAFLPAGTALIFPLRELRSSVDDASAQSARVKPSSPPPTCHLHHRRPQSPLTSPWSSSSPPPSSPPP